MADAADFASEREEMIRAAAMAARPAPGKAPALWYCEDCLIAIPEARRIAVPSCTRCVDCQAMAEASK